MLSAAALFSSSLVPPTVGGPAMRTMRTPALRMQEEPAEPAPAPEPEPAPAPKPKVAAPKNENSFLALATAGRAKLDAFGENTLDSTAGWATSTEPKDMAGMMALAKKQNPVLGFWDPLGVITEETAPETIGWFRHAEIKHGRVAMAGFVGYVAQYNGVCFPWNIQGPGMGYDTPAMSFAQISAAGGPADQWDALPTAAKVQIILVIGFLEMYGETSAALEAQGQKHYVNGGKPGFYPSFQGNFPHPVPLDLWDPFGFTKKLTPERKEQALIAEVNNGRLAMIGLFSLISASKGLEVPALGSMNIKPYAGEIMAPFTAADNLPFVPEMAAMIGNLGY